MQLRHQPQRLHHRQQVESRRIPMCFVAHEEGLQQSLVACIPQAVRLCGPPCSEGEEQGPSYCLYGHICQALYEQPVVAMYVAE